MDSFCSIGHGIGTIRRILSLVSVFYLTQYSTNMLNEDLQVTNGSSYL
jgi:hypothetical protein